MAKKLLIADDEQDVVHSLSRILTKEGYTIITAFNGQEAINQISREKPDIILLDLIMPILNGWEVLKWLREEAKLSTPTIIISAKDEFADMKKSYTLEANHYLTKPITIPSLIKSIKIVSSLPQEYTD